MKSATPTIRAGSKDTDSTSWGSSDGESETGWRSSSKGSVGSDELPAHAAADAVGKDDFGRGWRAGRKPPQSALRARLRGAGSLEEKRRLMGF